MTNLDVHVYQDREGRWRARCTGTDRHGVQRVVRLLTSSDPRDNAPEHAAESAVRTWRHIFGREVQP